MIGKNQCNDRKMLSANFFKSQLDDKKNVIKRTEDIILLLQAITDMWIPTGNPTKEFSKSKTNFALLIG